MAMKAAPARQPLSRDGILAAAIDLADAEGVSALSMRNLARRLGFEVMALYNHIANKNDLLYQMADAVAAEIEEPSVDLAPIEAVRAIALATRGAFVKHLWASDLWLKHPPGPGRSTQMEFLLRTLHKSGLSDELAHHGFHAVNNHVAGYTLQEQGMTLGKDAETAEDQIHEYLATLSGGGFPYTEAHVHQHLNGETTSSFELVLDLILDGLVRLNDGYTQNLLP
ncbi:MAG: AcrR family transcriptional regulator [Verrucomicrobiales bacterium]|jgi:AcrR family transcriptional regulator